MTSAYPNSRIESKSNLVTEACAALIRDELARNLSDLLELGISELIAIGCSNDPLAAQTAGKIVAVSISLGDNLRDLIELRKVATP